MNQWIERYIYAVVKRLPESMKKEVSEELRANISDMLSDKPTDDEIELVLKKLGNPRVLANNYRGKERYVVSPLFYDDYINVLKIVFIIFAVFSVVFGAIDAVISLDSSNLFEMIFEVFGAVISGLFEGLFQAFAIVTIIFWIISYVSQKSTCDEWKVKDLPEIPKASSAKIGRTGSVVGLIFGVTFSVIWVAILMRYLDYFGIYNNGTYLAPIFNQNVTDMFIPYYIASAIFVLIVSLLKIYYAEWRLEVTIPYTAYQILSAILAMVFITYPGLIHPDLFSWIATSVETTVPEVINGFTQGMKGFAVFIAIVTGLDVMGTWYKTLKAKKTK
jgi:hypothetical protein